MNQDGLWQGYEVISQGANRVCVVDPENSQYCLKFDLRKDQAKSGLSNRIRRLLADMLPNNSFAHQEYRRFNRLRAKTGADVAQHFALADGLVTTAHGVGLRCQRIVNADGSAAQPIHYYFDNASQPDLPTLLDAVDRFGNFLLHHDIPLFDLNSGNLLVRQLAAGYQIVCVDTKSLGKTKELIPLSLWFKFLRTRKLRRRLERLKNMISDRKLPPP